MEQVRERATDTWDKLEKVFEDRVQRALVRLGVPSRDDLSQLSTRVDSLTSELRKLGKTAPADTAKPAAKKVKKTKKVATPVEAKVAPDAAAKK